MTKLTHKKIKIYSAICAIAFFVSAPVIRYAVTPNDQRDDVIEIKRNVTGVKTLDTSNVSSHEIIKNATIKKINESLYDVNQFNVDSVSIEPSDDKDVRNVIVRGTIMHETPDGNMGKESVIYSSSYFLSSGKMLINRIDEGAARDVAWKVLSTAFITLSEGKIVGDKIMFDALVGGQKCSLVMSIRQSIPPRWVEDEINCKK